MISIGVALLWLGYTAFAFGHALDQDAQVTFSDMVLPSHRSYAMSLIKNPPNPSGQTATPGVPGASGQTPLGPVSPTTQLGGAGLGGSQVGNASAGASALGTWLKQLFG